MGQISTLELCFFGRFTGFETIVTFLPPKVILTRKLSEYLSDLIHGTPIDKVLEPASQATPPPTVFENNLAVT